MEEKTAHHLLVSIWTQLKQLETALNECCYERDGGTRTMVRAMAEITLRITDEFAEENSVRLQAQGVQT